MLQIVQFSTSMLGSCKNRILIGKQQVLVTTFQILAISLILGLGCTAVTNSAEVERNQEVLSFDKLRSGIVHIGQRKKSDGSPTMDVEKWFGTGFLIDDRCTFLTAKHVVELAEKERLVLRFQLPQQRRLVRTVATRVLYEDPDKDLAFLRIDKIGDQPCRSGELYQFSVLLDFDGKSLVGESVWVIGHPTIFKNTEVDIPVVRGGIIASTEIGWGAYKQLILLDLFGVPGFSGSPVIQQKTGQVIGVILGPGPTPRSTGFEWATPITQRYYEKATKQ